MMWDANANIQVCSLLSLAAQTQCKISVCPHKYRIWEEKKVRNLSTMLWIILFQENIQLQAGMKSYNSIQINVFKFNDSWVHCSRTEYTFRTHSSILFIFIFLVQRHIFFHVDAKITFLYLFSSYSSLACQLLFICTEWKTVSEVLPDFSLLKTKVIVKMISCWELHLWSMSRDKSSAGQNSKIFLYSLKTKQISARPWGSCRRTSRREEEGAQNHRETTFFRSLGMEQRHPLQAPWWVIIGDDLKKWFTFIEKEPRKKHCNEILIWYWNWHFFLYPDTIQSDLIHYICYP